MAKRILIYTNHYYPEQFKINDVVVWLKSLNYNIRVVTCIPNYPSGKFYKGYNLFNGFTEQKDNVTINRLPIIPRGKANSFMLTLNYLSYYMSCTLFTIYLGLFVKKYDIVLVHHTSPFFIALNPVLYGCFKKCKKILWDLDIWPETLEAVNIVKSKYLISLLKGFVSFTYSYYDKILISSKGLISTVKKRFNNGIEYFPNWADKKIEDILVNTKIKFKIPEKKFIIMYTGNIGQSQNFDSLITSIKYFNKTNNILWVFVGEGRYRKTFMNKLSSENLEQNCLFTGHVESKNVPAYSKYADAMFLSLNDNEIFNNTLPAKLQTYMALQKPIIAVLKGEGEKIILDSKCGIVENNNDYLSLCKKIEILLNLSKSELIKMGINGREYYKQNFYSLKRKKQLIKILEA